MIQFTDFLQEKYQEFDEKKHRWITIKDKKMQNQHIMLNKKDGTIAAGMGGKHNGETLDDVYDEDKNKSSSSSDKSSKEVSTTKKTDATDSKTSSKKLSMTNIRKTITDEHIKKMDNTLNSLQRAMTSRYGADEGIQRERSGCIHAFTDLPKSIQDENREEYDNLLSKSNPRRLYKKIADISSLAKKIKKKKSLDDDEKALLDKALEAGGLDKFIEDSLKENMQASINLIKFKKKCKQLKSEYNSTPEGKKEQKNKDYAIKLNSAGQWIDYGPTGGFGTYWRGPRTEYNEEKRVKKIESILDDIERDIKKSGEVAEINLGRKNISIEKNGKYSYNGKAIDRDEVIDLIKDNKDVSVNTKQVSEQSSDETKSNETDSTNKRNPSLRDIQKTKYIERKEQRDRERKQRSIYRKQREQREQREQEQRDRERKQRSIYRKQRDI